MHELYATDHLHKERTYGNNENSYCTVVFFTPEQNLWENFWPSFTQDTVKSAKTVKFSPFHLHLIFPVTVTPFKFCYGTWFETTKYRSKTSKPEITFPFSAFPVSALTLLVKRQEGHPACEKKLGVGLLVVTFCLELCTSYSSTSITLSSNRNHNGDILVLANPGTPGKWLLKQRERLGFRKLKWCNSEANRQSHTLACSTGLSLYGREELSSFSNCWGDIFDTQPTD